MTSIAGIRAQRSLAIGKAGLYLATFMAVFDIAVVYLALPSIERTIGAGLADQQWIASAYGLMEAGLTLAAGTLGDLYGRRRVYLLGVIVFILGSIASGFAPFPWVLILSRFVQGSGGAIMMALPLAILISMVTDKAARERSIRTYATIASMGAVVAPVAGGWLVQALGWRSIFFVNVPLSLFALYAGFAHTTESPRDPSRKLDLGGQVTSALALIAFAFTVIEGNALGWQSPAILAGAAVAIASGIAFVAIERRVKQPMIRFALLREPLLSAGVWNMLAMNIGFFTLYLIASLFIQDVRRVDALTTGWLLLGNNLLFFLSNQFSGRIVRLLGEGRTALAGMGLSVLGLASFAFFNTHTAAAWMMIPLALCGLGWGVAFTPINDLAMSVVPERDDGMASGLLSLGRPLGAVFGTAVFGAVLGGFMAASLRQALNVVHAPASALGSIAGAIHHGGIWAVMHHALKWGLPPHTLRTSVEAGFITGMRVSGVLAALMVLAAIGYGVIAYRTKSSA